MTWLLRLVRRGRMEELLDRELRFHLDAHTADLVARGMPPDEARRRARLALGGPEQVKEQCRDARGTRWLDDLRQDVRYAVRDLWRRPGFASVALLTLALGSSATTVMFTVIDGVLFSPLPFADPGSLLNVEEQTKGNVDYRWGDRWAFSYPNFLDCSREVRSLRMGAYRYNGGTLSAASADPERVDGLQISADLLPLLGVAPIAGRVFAADEDRPGAEPVMLISSRLWQRRFGNRASAIGAQLVFDATPYTIVGVVPASFNLRNADVITPIGQNTLPVMRRREVHPQIGVWARPRPGVPLSAAQAELDVVARRLAAEYPESNAGRGFIAEPLRPSVGNVGSTLWLLLAAVSLVLLIACVNIASLLLARAVSRDRETAMRAALGAGRGRLARQHLTESAVLGVCGGALGLLLAAAALRPFIALWPGGLPRGNRVELDWRVLAFATAVSLACAFLFGLAPALRASARRMEQSLRASARSVTGSRRLHGALVAAEIALALVLLVSAGLLAQTLVRLWSVDPGVNVHNVLTSRAAISPAVLADPPRIRAAWRDLIDRAHTVPGVRAVAMVDTVPMRAGNNQLGYWTAPPEPERAKKPLALANSVTPEYLAVMGIPLRRGRFFDDRDRIGAERVAVIDEVMAQDAFGAQDPIGRRIWTDLVPEPLVVVGVVGHVRHWGVAADDDARVRDQFYYPFSQVPDSYLRRWSELMSIAVRTDVDPLAVTEPLRHTVRGAAGDQVLYETRTLEQLAEATLAQQRFLFVLFAVFAGLALLLACIGVYGVLAYLSGQRVPEFGVRIALGATARDVVRLVMRQSAAMIGAGLIGGAAGAWAAARVLARLVEGMRAPAPATLAAMMALLVLPALFASFLPARRASRVDAMAALRQE